MEHITTHPDGPKNKAVKHVAVELSMTEEHSTTPLYLPFNLTNTWKDGQPDGYAYDHFKTTIHAKVYTDNINPIRCGILLTYRRKKYVIETIEYDASSPYVRVIAVNYGSDKKPEIVTRTR